VGVGHGAGFPVIKEDIAAVHTHKIADFTQGLYLCLPFIPSDEIVAQRHPVPS
jgi:hypothetical protein